MADRPFLYVCSSPRDDRHLDQMLAHLRLLPMEVFSPHRVRAGADAGQIRRDAVARAAVAVVLLSSDLFEDPTAWDTEFAALHARQQALGMPLVPVLLRDCAFSLDARLAGLVVLPRDKKPLVQEDRFDESAARGLVQELTPLIGQASPQARPSAEGIGPRRDWSTPAASRQNPWLDTLRTTRGKLSLGAALVVLPAAAAVRGLGWVRDVPWLVVVAAILLLCGAGTYLWDVGRRRRLVFYAARSVFPGARPLTEADQGHFFERETEVDEVLGRLRNPRLRYLVIFGESGCGKSSLLRAGVLPALSREGTLHGVYLRFFDQPVRELHEALRAVCPDGSERDVAMDPGRLLEALHAARTRAGRPLALFIDQFEEFHVNPVSEEAHRAVQELVWSVISREASGDSKLVFCLRYDFLHQLDVFEDGRHINNIFDDKESRFRLQPFDDKAARRVIWSTVRQRGGPSWGPQLVERILGDLVVWRQVSGKRRGIVLPTEMQIVCQMVQGQRIVEAREYPGKKQLVREYVDNAIEGAPANPTLTRQVLLNLIDDNEVTKARPRTLAQLAARLSVKDTRRLRLLLDYLDKDRHIVESTISPELGGEVGYELAHDYLAAVVRGVAGTELAGTRRSQAILSSSRLQRETNPRFRLGIGDSLRLLRYPPEEMTAEDRDLLRSSLVSFVLRVCLPSLCAVALLIWLRVGTVHLRLRGDRVVTARGCPYLVPLLGSQDTWIDTGIDLRVETESTVLSQVRERVRRNPWIPEFWAERLLRQRAAEVSLAYLRSLRGSYRFRNETEDQMVRLWLSLDLPTPPDLLELYRDRLRDGLAEGGPRCGRAEEKSRDCQNRNSAIGQIARGLRRLSEGHSALTEELLRRVPHEEGWSLEAIWTALIGMRGMEETNIGEMVRSLSGLAPPEVARRVALLDLLPGSQAVGKLLPPATQTLVVKGLLGFLEGKADEGERAAALRSLARLKLADPELLRYLDRQLATGPDDEVADVLKICLALHHVPGAFFQRVNQVLEKGRDGLLKTKNWCNNCLPFTNPPGMKSALAVLDRLSEERSWLNLAPIQEASRGILAAMLAVASSPRWLVDETVIVAREAGMTVRELYEMLPPAEAMSATDYRALLGRSLLRARTDGTLPADRIRPWMPELTDEEPSSDECEILLAGRLYGVQHPGIQSADRWCREYMPRRQKASLLAARGLWREGEDLQTTTERLVRVLLSDENRYPGIRKVVADTFDLTVDRYLDAHEGQVVPVQAIADRLRGIWHQQKTPLYLRVAIVEIVEDIEGTVYSRGSRIRPTGP